MMPEHPFPVNRKKATAACTKVWEPSGGGS
jgi:hypothetical protein